AKARVEAALSLSVRSRVSPAGFAGVTRGAPSPPPRRADPDVSVETLAGVGPKVAERLGRLGIVTIRDLVEHIPRAYDDWSEATGFAGLALGQEATVRCAV